MTITNWRHSTAHFSYKLTTFIKVNAYKFNVERRSNVQCLMTESPGANCNEIKVARCRIILKSV